MNHAYMQPFFAAQGPSSLTSAREVVPIVIDLIRPRSVIDIGCGHGTWLAAFQECGVTDLFGVDGSWVKTDDLVIDSVPFRSLDLEQPFELERRFDLAVSLEVAEHLPGASAATFVNSLVQLAPVVLFGAAVPGQRGAHHVNEQWPSYWADLFLRHGYAMVDVIRPKVWTNQQVAWWYAQNTFLFVHEAAAGDLETVGQIAAPAIVDLAHPRMNEMLSRPAPLTTRQVLHLLPAAFKTSLEHRFRRLLGGRSGRLAG
jgi:SAM-dependent methyltransferase